MSEPENISLRFRGSRLSKVKEIDLFPKIEDTYQETSSVGGTFSIFSFALIVMLIYSEINYYLDSKFIFRFTPDIDYDAKLQINVDMTIAMPCNNLGADILDSTNQNTFKFGQLEEEDTWYELDEAQKAHFQNKQHFNSYLREEYHSIKDLLWKRSFSNLFYEIPKRQENPNRPYDACRIHGSLILNKVAGNFHITAGKSLNLPRGHIHISAFMSDTDYNFTHRIDRFSFGENSPGIVHPLEGDEFITTNRMILYQYFIEVVPTSVNTFLKSIDTYQYSVKELSRPIDHSKGSHGMPGIFFKYDVSALKVTVSQRRDHFGMFITKLCCVIAGIYISSGILTRLIQFIYNLVLCRYGKPVLEKGNNKEANLVLKEKLINSDATPIQLL